ncbi:unnamed protein product [Hyaloperonospora brassicae]|uniref:Glycosyltransferase 2-like domain-containing protein n=1 Tax=Hyaloperonospora brassicae TaxID=162125 RepID=A0AAV0TAN1_HYABA|nr:unnamed protein product [Hyaloperonospora brassicae]
MNNCLFNEDADGTYMLIMDNDMKPHPKVLLAGLSFIFSKGEAVDGGGLQCSDDISWTHVSYVQTPADSSRGRDGFDSGALAGSNAVFCRQAFDSIGGIQYGTPSEDAFTGNVVHTSGWDSVYFRKDFEGDAKDRIRLCGGAIPETVAPAMVQKKHWAKGSVQILLMQNEREVDPDWRPPRVPAPDPKPSLAFPRKMFFYDSVLYPFFRQQRRVAYAAGMAFVVVHYDDDNFEALQARVAGKDKSRANTGAGQKTSWIDITDVLFSFTLLFSQLVALIRFVEYVIAANSWNYVCAVFCDIFVTRQLYPMVKKRVPDVVFVQLWQVYYAGNLQVAQGIVTGTNDPAAATNRTHRIVSQRRGWCLVDEEQKETQDAMHAERR